MTTFRNTVRRISERILNKNKAPAHTVERPAFDKIALQFGLKVSATHEIRCSYDEGCLLALDWALPERLAQDSLDSEVTELGSYLGELIINRLGGSWNLDQGTWIVELHGTKIYPFLRARKRLENGRSESLAYFFQVLKRTLREEHIGIPNSPDLSALIGVLPKTREKTDYAD